MACVALTSLMATIELEFLQPRMSFHHDHQALIKFFFENLSSLQAFLQKESSGDGGAIRDLEIQIRDFALEAEDDIEIQLSNILLSEDAEFQEKASRELHQTLLKAAKKAMELLKILAREKESSVSLTEMASIALTILMKKIEYCLLQHFPTVSLDDEAAIISFFENHYSLQAFLQKEPSSDGGGAAIQKLETKIKKFALKAEDDIEVQLNNFLLAKDTEHEEEASLELRQTMQDAAENAAEFLKILNKEKEHERARKITSVALTSLIETIELEFLQVRPRIWVSSCYRVPIKSFCVNLSSLQAFLQKESSGDGAALKDLDIQIRDFVLKVEHSIQIKISKLANASWYVEHEALLEFLQTLHEAAKTATELLKILTRQKESCVSEREMAIVALSILITKVEYNFVQPIPMEYLDDEAAMRSLFQNLYSCQAYLLQRKSNCAPIKKLETKIKNFALKAEDDIETQLGKFLLAKDTNHEEEASQELRQSLREAAKIAKEIINSKKDFDNETEIEKACFALGSLMRRIKEKFLDDEAVRKSFLEKISSLQAFLQKESSGGAAVEDLETKIEDFAWKADRDFERQIDHLHRAKHTEYHEKVALELHQTMQEAEERAAELLKLINSRSNEVDEANETQPWNSWLKHASKSANVESGGSSRGFLKLEDKMVGRDHDCRVIKDQLLSSRSQLKLISIVGMEGIGKTTLAKKVYEDPSVALRFNVRGWITIPQHYSKTQILCDLLQSIMPAELNVIKKGSTLDELEMQIRKCLLGKRYLIVLDNILSTQDWIDIIQCVPNGIGGSCILLTTSHFKQEHYNIHYIHNMTLLDPKESWEVFCNTLPIKEHMIPKFEKIRNCVVEKCDGLPQLIVEVAKRLSECNNIQQGWKKIEKELESLGILDRNALTLSYNLLPHHLKVCFLYFGVFPKRNKILVKMLIRLWIIEGFVKPLEHNELEDQAHGYLQELIDRSLLLIENRSFDGKIKTCRMHSAMHSFCVGEAQKEGILCSVNTQQHSGLSLDAFANSCRWLSVCSHSFDYYVLFGTNIPRSIFFFHESPKMSSPLKLLRVLAFDTSIILQRVPVHVGDLFFLRYLSITQWFKDLDDVVSNNLNLQTLVVSGNGSPTVHLPSNIWKLPYLRHLELGNSCTVDPPSMVKENLQSLSCVVRSIHCRKEVYKKFPNIKKLKIFLKDDIEPNHTHGSCSKPIILENFDYLKGLEKLSISVSIGCNAALPKQSMFPSQLKKLKLCGTNLSEREMRVIAMLPQLMVLKLENAFNGTVWEVSKRAFRNLKFLLLEDIKLKQWVADYDNFPRLERLILKFCYCLDQIPKGIARIATLKSIEFKGCHSSLVASAKQLQRKNRLKNLEIKLLEPEYDESQNTHAKVSM